jgi:hypothetical protein
VLAELLLASVVNQQAVGVKPGSRRTAVRCQRAVVQQMPDRYVAGHLREVGDQHPHVRGTQQFGDALGARRAVPERDQLLLSSQTTPATTPIMTTAAMAISQVRIPKTAPIVPYVLLSETIVDEK